jgi:hypothetical protein
MLTESALGLLEGSVTVDESWIGGSLINQHQNKKEEKTTLWRTRP